MCLVCVRSVFNEMNSCRAISGPVSSVASRFSTLSSRSAQLVIADVVEQPRVPSVSYSGQQLLGVRPYVSRGMDALREKHRHRLPFVEEESAVAGRHSVGEGRSQVGRRRGRVAVCVVGERPHCPCFNQAAVAACRLRGVQRAVEQVERLAGVTLGNEQPGEGELVVLGQVGRRICWCDPVLARPIPRRRGGPE